MASQAQALLANAASRGDVAGMAAALLAGADPNARMWGSTLLIEAASQGCVTTITALLNAGADVDGEDTIGNTALMLAACDGDTASVAALLAAGADVHRAGVGGTTALLRASINGRLDAARMLVEAGARTDVRDNFGYRPIDLVCAQLCRPWRLRDRITPFPFSPMQRDLQTCHYVEQTNAPALRTLFRSAAPWSRRRPVALACYADVWEWEA
jgi:ankyrin repeat protein